ncbi:MAG: aldo/keto reductase [Deltaproteobacteria bacterium]|nr:aldo/keto reductase [Nannocystaceae bacterium]
MQTRAIPASGEHLPVIGLGTWQTFDVGDGEAERAPLREVLQTFEGAGARVIDSSPMYGRAEAVAGTLLAASSQPAFVATKVWTRGKARGIEEMQRSMRLLGHVDLMQVHNLLDVRTHLPTLRAWKAEGRIRYLGVTHYQLGAFDELEQMIREEQLDFVQLPYSVRVREAEHRLLPAAQAAGCAVLVMRPFEEGALFDAVRGKAVPEWAAELECASWAQLFLKWILGHPAVTCPIPATANPKHLADNLRAGFGPLPDAEQRARLQTELGA